MFPALLVFFREEVSPKIINPEGHRCGGRPSFSAGTLVSAAAVSTIRLR